MEEALTQALDVRRAASQSRDPRTAGMELVAGLGGSVSGPALLLLFADVTLATDELAREVCAAFPSAVAIGATTAGEIGPRGYTSGAAVAALIASPSLAVEARCLERLSEGSLLQRSQQLGLELFDAMVARGARVGRNTFGLMLADGLSRSEEQLASGVARGLAGLHVVGGSAGDGGRMQATAVLHQRRFVSDAATLALVSLPGHRISAFKHQHFAPGPEPLVVTAADPVARVVYELNARPAALEYARISGVPASSYDAYHAHPAVMAMGSRCYVRSAMRVLDDGAIQFACAIEEGVVLSVGTSRGLVSSLEAQVSELERELGGPPLVTIGFDCVGRLAELDELGQRGDAAALLERMSTIGFATYGEQFDGMHVNQTLTGIALAPDRG